MVCFTFDDNTETLCAIDAKEKMADNRQQESVNKDPSAHVPQLIWSLHLTMHLLIETRGKPI